MAVDDAALCDLARSSRSSGCGTSGTDKGLHVQCARATWPGRRPGCRKKARWRRPHRILDTQPRM